MKTCQDVINRAARKLNVVAFGQALPAAQSAEMLLELQSLYLELVGWGAFGRENDVLSQGDWTALPQQRVRMKDSASTIEIPDELPASIWWPDWWGWDQQNYWCWPIWPVCGSCCVAPRDLSIVTAVDPTADEAHTYLYDAYVGKWRALDDLALTDEAPLSRRWFVPLANVLAERMADDYGQQFKAPINAGLNAMVQRFGSTSPDVIAEYC